MRSVRFLPAVGLAFLFTFALVRCARLGGNTVSVAGRNFADEVALTQNLTFTFNRDVGPETPTEGWDSTQYVRFVPAVRGKFRWTSPSELLFSPAVGFEKATTYKAELTNALLTRPDQKALSVDADDIEFHTPYLRTDGVDVWWTRGRDTQTAPVAKLRLRLNYPVPTADVQDKLAVATEGNPLTTQLTGGDAGLTATLLNVPTGAAGQPITVTLAKGVAVPGSAYRTDAPLEQTATLPDPKRVDVTDVQTGFDNNEGTIRIQTTQELQPGNLTAYYTVQPAVETRAELTENGLLIRGAFNETDTYVLTLTEKLRGVLGATLPEPVSRDLFFGKMPASIRFAKKKAVYLSAKGARNVGLNLVNVPKVQVRIAKVYENNLLPFLRGNRYEEYAETNGTWGGTGTYTYSDDSESNFSDVLVDKAVQTTDLPRVNGVSALNVAVPQRAGNYRGVYLVTVASKDEAYLSATQLVAVSDIGLIARQTADEVLVWANSIRDNEPLEGVDVTLVSSNNQSVLTGKTDGKGFVKFEKVSEKAPGFAVTLLTARLDGEKGSEGDFTFLYLPDATVETSRFDVGGKAASASGFDAFVYGDRNIYRPGETIHLNTVVRKADWASPGEVPLTLRVLLPNGRELQKLRLQTNDEGAIATDVPLDPAAVTGTYTVEVSNANNVLLASQALSVEEFLPDRISVDVRTDRERYASGQTVTLSATATNLFGPPASDRAYEMELQLKPKVFAPKGFDEYQFQTNDGGKAGRAVTFEKTVRQGRTNANGQATERFALPATYQDIGLLDGKLFITVFDENGRPVNRLRKFDVLTQSLFYGVKLADSYVATNSPIAVALVALDADGKPKAVPARVDVVKYDYQTVIEKNAGDGSLKYSTKRREDVVYSNTLALSGGRGEMRYVPTQSGEYALRVRRPGSTGYVEANFYAYSYGSTSASSFEVSSEGQVLMQFDKPTYGVGDNVAVLFKAPFNGKLLVTLERNGVLEHTWLDTKDKAAQWSFKAGEGHLPNVYVTATLIRPMDNTDLPLTVAHGFASVPVSDADTKLPVTITAATASRSKTKQTIRIKTKAGAQVTVAVVDEGILQLKNYQTPDPHGYFYQKQALGVTPADGYALLFPELSLAGRSSFGGDGYDLEKRVNPLANGRVRLVALWSGILETGFDGEAEFTVDVPQFSGTLRVMAVAYKGRAFGSAAQPMTVADPVVISAGVPRFLSPGDELVLPVNLTNTTKKAAPVTVQLATSGPFVVVSDSTSKQTQQLMLPAGREARATFRVRAAQAIGPGALTVTVRGMGETFTDKTELTVRPAAPLHKVVSSGVVAGGQSATLPGFGGFLPGTNRASLTVSRQPGLQYAKALSYLLAYPHGCLEQTISRAFPQLYFADLVRGISKTNVQFISNRPSDLNPASNVRAAIAQVERQQLYNGSMALWPGQTKHDDWVTAYAAHFLTEAGRAGYEVNPDVLGKALDYLTTKTSTPALEDVTTYAEDGSRTVRQRASRTALYGLYVLAVAGQPNRSAMNYYKQHVSQLTTDGRYVLAGAFGRLGDERSATALTPKTYADAQNYRHDAGSYASPLRNLALALNTLADTDPDNLQIPTLARQLSAGLAQTPYLTTQEAAFGFLALGKLARQAAGDATAEVRAGSATLGRFTGADLVLKRLPAGQPVSVSARGSGKVYYLAQNEGVLVNGNVAEVDNGLVVRRQFLTRDGQLAERIKQNDLIIVKIMIAGDLPTENVVITDLQPAGFEVENPRLTEARGMDWMGTPAQPDYLDLRDDRINIYTSVTPTGRAFYYQVRAVTRGRFRLGPVAADAMYNPDVRSYHGAGEIVVE